jgi:hypothetical protein
MGHKAVVKVGPLAATSTTAVAASQSPAAASQLVLNGTLGTAVANNIALSQTITGAVAVTINGSTSTTLRQTGATGAFLTSPQYIYVTSAGNDSGITFKVVGLDNNGASVTETITGSNAGVAVSANQYRSIISITTSGSTAAAITVGSYGAATMDTPRQVLITTASAISFTITGTDWAGAAISETVTNSGASVASVLSYATVTSISASAAGTSITVGTNGVAYSPWWKTDSFALPYVSIQCTVTGTVNYTIQMSNDDPTAVNTGAATPATMTWLSNLSPINGATASAQATMSPIFIWYRVLLNSETAATSYVTTTFEQFGSVTY